jgi:MoaA/NifB/PqqE/SkfB family radical SAM enzyme
MTRLNRIIDRLPSELRRALRNKVTLALRKYLVFRPIYTKSIISGITIELTDRCNLACSYCPKSRGIGVKGGDMDFELFKTIVSQACELAPIRQIPLVGFGEPLLYPHLEEAVKYIKEQNHAIRVTLTTNGILLNSDWAKRLVAAGLDQITVSVNATSREQYREINRADFYDKVVTNTYAFLETVNMTSVPMRVLVQVLEGPNGPEEIKAFRSFWEPRLGVCGEIQVQPFVNWGGTIDTYVAANPAKEKRYPCAHLQNNWIVTREGDALACCMVFPDDQGDLALGNIKEKSLKQLYMEGRIKELRRLNIEGRLYDLSPCSNCDAYKTVPNVWIRNPLYPVMKRKWL